MGHIGDVHAHFPVSVGELAQGEGVVEVFGVGRVDGECRDAAEVFASGYFVGRDCLFDFVGQLFEFFGVTGGEAKLGENGVHLGVVLAAFAEYFHDFALWTGVIHGPVGEAHHDFFAFLRAVCEACRDIDAVVECAAVDPQHRFAGADFFDPSHDLLGTVASGDVGDFGFAAVFASVDEQILDRVAREGVAGVALAHGDGVASVVGGD